MTIIKKALILTALPVEYAAVRAHLADLREQTDSRGNIYEVGSFVDGDVCWQVCITEVGAGNESAAVAADRALHHFPCDVALFVGVAGGVKDVDLGDVVCATKVYGYESGKDTDDGFLPRSEVGLSTHALVQRARAEARKPEWRKRAGGGELPPPKALVQPIAAGQKVVASTRSPTFQFLRRAYSDAVAVEMEGAGFLKAMHAYTSVQTTVIRGISDLLSGKSEADASGSQETAARHAAAFAFQLLAAFDFQLNQSGHSESSTTETGSAAATPTWPDLLAAPPAFQVNAFDDLVLCMHPDAERDWRDAIPHAPAAVLSAFVVQTPQGPWHRDAPDVVVWESVHREIEAKVQEVMSQRPKRIHLVAKTPYSLGALLGAQLAPQNHQLLVYQHDNLEGSRDQKVWRPWGPTWPAAPGLRSADFFEMPPGMDRCRPEETGNLAVVVDITGRSNLESCVLAVRERYGEDGGSVRPVQIRAKLTGQGAIRQPADADKASTELAELLQLLSESFPNARLHVFYYGPLAVLIRASCGLSLRRTPIILWEAVYPNSQAQWIPAILFPEGRLLIADPRR